MDEFEKIRAFSAELGKKTEEAVAEENAAETKEAVEEQPKIQSEETEQANFLENWTSGEENVEEKRTLSRTFWFVLAGVSLLLLCLIVVIFLLLKGPIENDEVVTIAPTQKPVKVRPENPGGMQIPDQDKVIYSRLTQDTIPAKVEKLFPEEEKPVMPVITEEIPEEKTETDEEVKVVQGEPLAVEENLIVQEEKVEEKEPQKPEPKKTLPPKTETVKGEWKVQLFSSTDKAKVEKQWKSILQKQKALVSNMPMQIVPAEIPGKGTFYRLKVGAFETREMANALCVKLKKQKQDCIPSK